MVQITIERKNGRMLVQAPYHPERAKKFRNINGNWSNPYWIFDLREEQDVLAELDEVWGFTETGQNDLVDVTVKVADGEYLLVGAAPLYLGGVNLQKAVAGFQGLN